MRAVPRVLLAQNTWVRYRLALVRELQADSRVNIDFIHDPSGPVTRGVDAIAAIPSAELEREVQARQRGGLRLSFQPRLLGTAICGRYDAIVLQGDHRNISNWVVLIWGRLVGTPVLLWSHGWYRKDATLRRWVKRAFFGMSGMTMLYSQRGRDLGIQQGYPADRLVVVGNSLAPPGAAAVALHSERKLGAQGIRLISVARLTRDRELEDLLEAMRLIAQQGQRVHLDLVGDGEAGDALREIAQRNGLNVAFHGAVFSGTELAQMYGRADLCVVTGRAGLSVAQALFHGVPVIVHDDFEFQMPEADVIVVGETGELYKRRDPKDLASVILRVHQGRASGQYPAAGCIAAAHEAFSPSDHSNRIVSAILAVVADGPLMDGQQLQSFEAPPVGEG